MISYGDTERAYRLEKDSPTLQSIPPNFYAEAMELAGKPELSEHKNNILGLLSEIQEKRSRKILLHAMRSLKDEPPENATKQEADFYRKAVAILRENKESVFQYKPPEKKELDVAKTKIKILRPLPSILASDLKEYGPFSGSEIVDIPVDNAKILVAQGIAEEVSATSS